jgi:Pyruvate/2-oxoacid:ferredoxin oxidoreductase gamma subunit
MSEREILFTGIGGQGIQLIAKVLAQAAADEGRHVMLFGVYGGAMRGSPSESTLVIGDAPIEAPPIVPRCWSIVAMHPRSLPPLLAKLRPGGLLFANETLVDTEAPDGAARVAVPATRLAEEAGNPMGAGMILLGGFAAHTGVVSLDRAVAAMRASLPSHREKMADANEALLRRGAAWVVETAGPPRAGAEGA